MTSGKARRGAQLKRYIVGIDEVGRGPLAGPVVVGAVLVPAGLILRRNDLRDSKQLTVTARREWAAYIRAHKEVAHALALVGPRMIDRMNISRAANLAALRAVRRLLAAARVRMEECDIYLDGGLYLGNGAARLPAATVVKGDERIPAVALASIVAKVHRDDLMVRSAKRFPGYGFEVHKGYGTEKHRAALRRLGPSGAHRLTFIGKSNTIKAIK